jgi:hypothetical protein
MLRSSAKFSDCGHYRYSLIRIWDRSRPTILFIGLNPSTADAEKNDPTIRRCLGFAQEWNYGGLVVCNLFAYRSTDPRALRIVDDPIGPDNDAAIRQACGFAERIVVAWGIHGRLGGRNDEVLPMLRRPYCLGVTFGGSPKHPLYLAGKTRLKRYSRKFVPQSLTGG